MDHINVGAAKSGLSAKKSNLDDSPISNIERQLRKNSFGVYCEKSYRCGIQFVIHEMKLDQTASVAMFMKAGEKLNEKERYVLLSISLPLLVK